MTQVTYDLQTVARIPADSDAAGTRTHRWPILLAVGGGALLVLVLVPAFLGAVHYTSLRSVAYPVGPEVPSPQELRRLERRLAAQAPSEVYILIDTVANRLYLKRGDEILHEAVASTGTGALLEEPETGRRWIFDTPRGAHRVLSKTRDPVWKKPDWAFIEEGLPIPKDYQERLDPYSLGEYALYFGDGYLIHGTLYQRLLGRSVTHGCIRLGDEDLEAVYRAAPLGTPIYIF